MFIGLCGALCAGKHEVANYLVEEHGFKILNLRTRFPTTPAIDANITQWGPSGSPSGSGSHQHQHGILDHPVATSPVGANGHGGGHAHGYGVHKGDRNSLWFFDGGNMLEYVTKRWTERFVTTDIWDERLLEKLLMRPFFILVSVDAPVSVRWERYKKRCASHFLPSPSLADFVLKSDSHMYDVDQGLAPLINRASIRLVNPTESISTLHNKLSALDLVNEDRLRPTWDAYFMQLASLAAQRSNCMKRRVGCVLVQEKRVISTGYNGTPRGLINCNEGGCQRCNAGNGAGMALATCLCLHAEENALLEAGRERIREGSILYCDTCPCLTCSIKIVQVGVAEVVYSLGYSMDSETARVLEEGGVVLRQFHPPRDGLVNLVE